MMNLRKAAWLVRPVVLAAAIMHTQLAAQAAQPGPLKVGAAKADLTPAPEELPKQYLGILDQIYSRAIVVTNGHQTVGLITIDALTIPDPVWKRLSARIAEATGIPVKNLVITATGTHSVPNNMRNAVSPAPAEIAWERRVIQSVRDAQAKLQPAQLSYGTGVSYINVNRDWINPATGKWWEGRNFDAPSDKRVSVVKFSAANGDPIAVYYNYGVFNVITGTLDLVSSDLTGAASRYIEQHFDNGVVAALAAGPHGDQNPVFFRQTYELRDIRVKDYARRGEDIAIAMPPPGGMGLERANPHVAKLMDEQKQINQALGLMLGEEVIHAMRDAGPPASSVGLYSDQTVVACPGRTRTNSGRGGVAGTYVDDVPVEMRLGVVLIGDIAIASVNAGVYTPIGLRLRKESPYAKTIFTTRANGASAAGYIPDDASYGHETFAVLNSKVKPGCAENAIVNGIVRMMPPIRY